MSWRPDKRALASAEAQLGLRFSTKLKRTNSTGKRGGYKGLYFPYGADPRYRAVGLANCGEVTDDAVDATVSMLETRGAEFCRERDVVHSLVVSTYLRPEQASRTLWHELMHAAQLERFLFAGSAEARREVAVEMHRDQRRAYKAREIEREANEAKALHAEMALTRQPKARERGRRQKIGVAREVDGMLRGMRGDAKLGLLAAGEIEDIWDEAVELMISIGVEHAMIEKIRERTMRAL